MAANTAGQPSNIFVTRTLFGYKAFPGTHVTPKGSVVRFRNLTRDDLEVTLPEGVFSPNTLQLPARGAGVSTTVSATAESDLYEYTITDRQGFYAEGDSSPRIIVDP